MKFTVFTPAYNRAYVLPRLYGSLQAQTFRDFEWLIVDDGSTDGTEALCATFRTADFPVRYVRQPNSGKHAAINRGAAEACGTWFFIVDSDDWLPADSLELLAAEAERIASPRVAVLCGMKFGPDGQRIGGNLSFTSCECTPFEFRYGMRVRGDLAEVVRTDVLRAFPFPVFEGENFCPEAVVFNRIGRHWLTHYFNRNIYFCEYLPDGLSAHITARRMKSWRASLVCYAEQAQCPVPWRVKAKSWINFWRFRACGTRAAAARLGLRLPFAARLFVLPGWLLHLLDVRRCR